VADPESPYAPFLYKWKDLVDYQPQLGPAEGDIQRQRGKATRAERWIHETGEGEA
jgi:hypothetical protein